MNSLPREIKLTYYVAISLMIFLVCFVILVVYLYNKKQLLHLKEKQLDEARHQNLLMQKELENHKLIIEERKRISADMHDDLGAGISAMKLQAEYLKKKSTDQEIKTDIDDLLKIAEDMNLSMREMLWTLNFKNDNLANFVHYAINYSENFFRKTPLKVLIEKSEISDREITAEMRRNFFLCFKEALNNVYKHSDASTLLIKFTEERNLFFVDIVDDGIGLQPNINSGNGMRNMKMRMSDCNGNLHIVDSEKGLHLQLRTKWD